MDPKIAIQIIALVICPLLEWLEQEAKKTETPVDDKAVAVLAEILCKKR